MDAASCFDPCGLLERGDGDHLFWEVIQAPKENEKPEFCFISLNEDDELKSGFPFIPTAYSE